MTASAIPSRCARGTNCRTAQTRTLTSTTVTTYTYECAASLKRSGRDDANRLTRVNDVVYDWDSNGNTYNGDGLLANQAVGGVSITSTWDVASGLPQVLATSSGARYLYGLALLAQQQTAGGAWQYPLADGLGSIRYLTDPQGQPQSQYSFDPFGVPLSPSGGQPFGYAGEQPALMQLEGGMPTPAWSTCGRGGSAERSAASPQRSGGDNS